MDRRQLAALIAAPLLIITAALMLSTSSAAITIPTPAHQQDARGANTGILVVVAAPQCVTVTTDVPAVQLDPALRISAPEVAALQQLVGTTPDSVYGPQTAAALPAQAPAQACPPGYEEAHSPLLDAIGALNAQAGDLTTARQAALSAPRLVQSLPVASQSAPTDPANSGCDDPVIAGIITGTFGSSAPKALAVAGRESGCNPCGFYPSQHDCSAVIPPSASGLFQLLGHQDILDDVCPPTHPDGSSWFDRDHTWANPWCNTQAAWRLSNGGTNWSPWNASGG